MNDTAEITFFWSKAEIDTTKEWNLAHSVLVSNGIKNFAIKELQCKGSGDLLLHIPSLVALQRVRQLLGRPLRLTSAYRSPAHNAKVGGANGSWHVKGRAFDVVTTGWTHVEKLLLAVAAGRAGFGGIGFYPEQGFIHLDTGPLRSW